MFEHKGEAYLLASTRILGRFRVLCAQLALVHAFTFDTSTDGASTRSAFTYIAIATINYAPVVRSYFVLSRKQFKS